MSELGSILSVSGSSLKNSLHKQQPRIGDLIEGERKTMGDEQAPAVRKCRVCNKLFQDWSRIGHCDDCDRKILRERYWAQKKKKGSILGDDE